MKNYTGTILTTFIAILFTSQTAMASNEDAIGYDELIYNKAPQLSAQHSEADSLNSNLEDAATYGALYNSIAGPITNGDEGHGIHEHEFTKVNFISPQAKTSHILIGDPFYYDTSR